MQEGLHISLKADILGHVFGVPITNTMVMSWLVMLLLVVCAAYIGRRLTKIPSRMQTGAETLYTTLLNYIEEVLGSRTLALRFFPLLTTLFLFILLGNWLGLIPGIGSVTVEPSAVEASVVSSEVHAANAQGVEPHRVSLLYPMSVDLNVTLALAIVAFLSIEVAGIRFLGFFTYMCKFFNVRSILGFLIGIIELISECVRLISFSFRLFGNMFAGKTLIIVAFFFLPYIIPVPLMMYEVLVGFVQASIFTLLTLFFIKLAVSEAH